MNIYKQNYIQNGSVKYTSICGNCIRQKKQTNMPPIVTRKGLRISTGQTGLHISTGTTDLHTSTGYTDLLEFTELTDLQTSTNVQVY